MSPIRCLILMNANMTHVSVICLRSYFLSIHHRLLVSQTTNTLDLDFKSGMEFLFGKKKTPAQMLRENQRLLTRAMRDLDRERANM